MEPMLTLMLVLVFKESAILYEDTKKILFGYFKVFYQVVSASLEHSISSYTIAAHGPSLIRRILLLLITTVILIIVLHTRDFSIVAVPIAATIAACSRSISVAFRNVVVTKSVDCPLDQVQIRRSWIRRGRVVCNVDV